MTKGHSTKSRSSATARPSKTIAKPSGLTLENGPVSLAIIGLMPDSETPVLADDPSLLMPLQISVVEVKSGAKPELVDRSGWLLLPAGQKVSLRSISQSARVLRLTFRPEVRTALVQSYDYLGLKEAKLDAYVSKLQVLPRTVWVHEICHRYLFERQVLQQHDNAVTRFLEEEILKEAYYLCRDREDGTDRSPVVQQHSPPVQAALEFIEKNLFETLSVSELAKRCGASESTLLRAFTREIGSTPGAYWRSRRLDEALAMLASGRYTAAEVAVRVGYENPAAFAHAFQQRFSRSPSSLIPRGRRRAAP